MATATFTIDTVISGEGTRFLYQVIQEQVSGVHTTILSKTTDGPPRSKSLWIPPCTVQWYLSISYDGTNFGDNIEIAPNQAYRLSAQARAVRITIL